MSSGKITSVLAERIGDITFKRDKITGFLGYGKTGIKKNVGHKNPNKSPNNIKGTIPKIHHFNIPFSILVPPGYPTIKLKYRADISSNACT